MNKRVTKTNNDLSLIDYKVQLRINSIEKLKEIKVLELFGGEGILWKEVIKKTGKKIKILSIDKNKYKKIQLQGDNLKFIDSLDLNQFDVIDIDAWGSPFKQLKKIIEKKYKGIVHCTFIQTMYGSLDKEMLVEIGYSKEMVNKIPTLFNKNGIYKMKQYLSINGISEIEILTFKNKNYFTFYLHN